MPTTDDLTDDNRSLIEKLSDALNEKGVDLKQYVASMPNEQREQLIADWRSVARASQLFPAHRHDIRGVVNRMGRGGGKTRSGSETVIELITQNKIKEGALVSRTPATIRRDMINGDSGILGCSKPNFRPNYEPSKRIITWPNGAVMHVLSGADPELARGMNLQFAWFDEAAHYQYLEQVFSNVDFALRRSWQDGSPARWYMTTTMRPLKFMRDLIKRSDVIDRRGSTLDNKKNLDKGFLTALQSTYGGTRLYDQEVLGEILDDVQGALFGANMIDPSRTNIEPKLERVCISVDPAATANQNSDETGIIVAGLGSDSMFYVLDDLSGRMTPNGWAQKAVDAYNDHKANAIVLETNQGGDMAEATIKNVDRNAKIVRVHARTGKKVRAEPIAALYEQQRIKHVVTDEQDMQRIVWCDALERQLLQFTGKDNQELDDRVDAMVQAITWLMDKPQKQFLYG